MQTSRTRLSIWSNSCWHRSTNYTDSIAARAIPSRKTALPNAAVDKAQKEMKSLQTNNPKSCFAGPVYSTSLIHQQMSWEMITDNVTARLQMVPHEQDGKTRLRSPEPHFGLPQTPIMPTKNLSCPRVVDSTIDASEVSDNVSSASAL